MSKITYEVEYLRTGQTRAYGPHETEAVLSIFMTNYYGVEMPYNVSAVRARQIAHTLIGWAEFGEGDWASSRLRLFENVSDGKWRVVTRSPYTD